MLNYHPAKYGDYGHYDNGNIKILAYHVILQDHMIKGSCDFMGRNPPR